MSIIFNGTNIPTSSDIIYNGVSVTEVIFNNVTVWKKLMDLEVKLTNDAYIFYSTDEESVFKFSNITQWHYLLLSGIDTSKYKGVEVHIIDFYGEDYHRGEDFYAGLVASQNGTIIDSLGIFRAWCDWETPHNRYQERVQDESFTFLWDDVISAGFIDLHMGPSECVYNGDSTMYGEDAVGKFTFFMSPTIKLLAR